VPEWDLILCYYFLGIKVCDIHIYVAVIMVADIAGGYSSRSLTVSTESWIGHPMDPIGCLFSVLLDAADSTSAENRTGEFISLIM